MPVPVRAEGLCRAESGSVTLQSKVVPRLRCSLQEGSQERARLTVEEFPQATAHLFLGIPIYRTLEVLYKSSIPKSFIDIIS